MKVKLNGRKEVSINDIKIYNKPKYIYIPLIKDETVIVKKGDYVFKGEIVAHTKGNLYTNIHSSVSGTVIDFVEKTYLDSSKVKCLKIENDFKERIENRIDQHENISDYSKQEFIDILKECGIVGLGGAGFPTYKKYENNNIKTLIVNGVECEPYLTADYMMLKTHISEILEAIDAIMEINKIEKCYIAIKKKYTELINIINEYIGTYLKIKLVLVPDIYPMGWEKQLVEYITSEKIEKLPIEKGIVVNNVSTIYAIYEALKYHKPLIEKLVTVTGDMIKNPTNILVKIGTPFDEVIEYIGGYKRKKDIILIAGGPMMGKSIDKEDLIISSTLGSVIANEYGKVDKTLPCLRCGKCVNVCPAKIEPVLIKDYINNEEVLKNLNVDKCISCGLCSYICPSKIDVRNYVNEAKNKIRKDK